MSAPFFCTMLPTNWRISSSGNTLPSLSNAFSSSCFPFRWLSDFCSTHIDYTQSVTIDMVVPQNRTGHALQNPLDLKREEGGGKGGNWSCHN
ncbi:hypothetical protein LguiB_020406 [Lonicera macranthoides]